MIFTNEQYIFVGEIINYASLAINICMTSAAMLGWPSKSAYDPWWTSSGFCVVDAEHSIIPTELLCFVSLSSSAAAALFFLKTNNVNAEQRLKLKRDNDNPLLAERIQSSVFANAAHGFGHAFLWFMGTAAPPLELSLDPSVIANILMLILFWVGTLRNVVGLPTNHASAMAITVLSTQYVLKVPPELAFTYSQSVIFVGGNLELLRRKNDYSEKNNGFLFFAISLQFLPLFILYYFEMFKCSESFLSMLGGHAFYDLYLSLFPFGLYYAVIEMEKSSKNDKGD